MSLVFFYKIEYTSNRIPSATAPRRGSLKYYRCTFGLFRKRRLRIRMRIFVMYSSAEVRLGKQRRTTPIWIRLYAHFPSCYANMEWDVMLVPRSKKPGGHDKESYRDYLQFHQVPPAKPGDYL